MYNSANAKIFVCSHQNIRLPKNPLLVPLQVGAALADVEFDGYLRDDDGENISSKNRTYCELTGQYWAWKNTDVAYYGFFHYRRFLYPDTDAKRPYRFQRAAKNHVLEKLNYEKFSTLIQEYDLIVPKGIEMFTSVRDQYASAKFHHREDLELMESILRKRHPEDIWAMELYLSSTVQYFGNIFIMRREVFRDYMGWLFPCLEEYERCADLTGYSPQEMRVVGYLSERLLGIYYTKKQAVLRTIELPGVYFFDGMDYLKKVAVYNIFPPGTKRRARIKQWVMKNRG